jgi:hypothetical protein
MNATTPKRQDKTAGVNSSAPVGVLASWRSSIFQYMGRDTWPRSVSQKWRNKPKPAVRSGQAGCYDGRVKLGGSCIEMHR